MHELALHSKPKDSSVAGSRTHMEPTKYSSWQLNGIDVQIVWTKLCHQSRATTGQAADKQSLAMHGIVRTSS